ncbi:MAG TPA: DUF1801 domain-containing protein [Bryobacteraceae bacterium]|nr:DUF1801 domain-containing protein [Bryobacteraceae bacterium]
MSSPNYPPGFPQAPPPDYPEAMPEYLTFNGALDHDPAVASWLRSRKGPLGDLARRWFTAIRNAGDEVRELFHDGCPVVLLGDAPFAYVNAFTSHVNVGFYHGNALPDPAHLLQGVGKNMRHVKLKPDVPVNDAALQNLIDAAFRDIKFRVENR